GADRRLVRVGMHLGHARAVVRAEGPRGGGRARPHLDPLRARTLQYAGRSRLRGGARRARGPAAAGPLAAVRDGQGRKRSEDVGVPAGGGWTGGRTGWATGRR